MTPSSRLVTTTLTRVSTTRVSQIASYYVAEIAILITFGLPACNVLVAIEQQSPDIAQGLDHGDLENHGAGDQGIMFGYATECVSLDLTLPIRSDTRADCCVATSETKEYMPLTLVLAHALNKKMADERRNGNLGWLRPDVSAIRTGDALIWLIAFHTVQDSGYH